MTKDEALALALDALETSKTALDDWLNTYASELCNVSRVQMAWNRINAAHGTIAYIAELQQTNSAAITAIKQAQQAQQAQEPLYRAAINCPHEIDRDQVVLKFDPKQPGHNALNQLGRRLDAAISAPNQG